MPSRTDTDTDTDRSRFALVVSEVFGWVTFISFGAACVLAALYRDSTVFAIALLLGVATLLGGKYERRFGEARPSWYLTFSKVLASTLDAVHVGVALALGIRGHYSAAVCSLFVALLYEGYRQEVIRIQFRLENSPR